MNDNKKLKILIIRISAMGDSLLCSGILKALSEKGFEVHFLTSHKWASFFSRQNYVSKVIEFKKDKEIFSVIDYIRSQKYHISVDLQKKLRTVFINNISNAKIKLSCNTFRLNRLLFKHNPKNMHTLERYLTAFKKTNIKLSLKEVMPFAQADVSLKNVILGSVNSFFGKSNKKPIIVISPFASRKIKEFPLKRFFMIADLLFDTGYNIIFSGLDSEISLIKRKSFESKFMFFSIKSLDEYASLLSVADCFLGCDSGPKNIAEAIGVKSVVLWGATNPVSGFGVFNGTNITPKIKCSPCTLTKEKNCKYPKKECYYDYSDTQIVNAVIKSVKENKLKKTALSD